ncbi:putative inorganic carbon transporter subunit DabA [Legionella yabuuchiae]|uniref:putative inorganic carbon transporter subunit DabA n=1 Tax=Legionella yabuuchiae TaxID=376727 RepID=UPI0024154EBF|nr:putative inorganic carbon transporter subunit DabA [Legionella yabuuchiae]
MPELEKTTPNLNRPDAQFVFCIDVRSEPFRRAIEAQGNYETLGFAGFFGLPIRVKDYHTGKIKDSCPVLLKPRFNIEEKPVPSYSGYVEEHQTIKGIYNALKTIYQELKYNFSTPFALAESLGIWCGITMLLKSITSSSPLASALSKTMNPTIATEPCCEVSGHDLGQGISLNEQIIYADIILRLMGLTENFAKVIVLCGHGSSTQNNPYASALDCGACGGNHGGVNAKLLAQILNKQVVRQTLQEKGIHIPLDTVFLGAQHDTTTDSVSIYHTDKDQSNYPELLDQLMSDLEQAKSKNHIERGQHLNGFNTPETIERRSIDWSETRPEWGLAKNAAFIIAPRYLTKNTNLKGRCFLHSYRWDQDTDGSLLETILTAPMVVAQWINTQYLFSTIDNIMYGSGSKITHNITGKIGVMQGNGSDLMHGLPLQSVMFDDKTPYHSPQRLLTIVYANRMTVSDIINKQSILKTLFFNEWVHLVVIDPLDNLPYKLCTDGEWSLAI